MLVIRESIIVIWFQDLLEAHWSLSYLYAHRTDSFISPASVSLYYGTDTLKVGIRFK